MKVSITWLAAGAAALIVDAALVTGCSEGAADDGSGMATPFQWTADVRYVGDVPAPPPPAGRCPQAPTPDLDYSHLIWEFEGTATQPLGEFTNACDDCSLVSIGGSLTTDGECTITNADGDELFVIYAGRDTGSEGDSVSWKNIAIIVGGTGRFEGASGFLQEEATVSLTARAGTSTGEGMLIQ